MKRVAGWAVVVVSVITTLAVILAGLLGVAIRTAYDADRL